MAGRTCCVASAFALHAQPRIEPVRTDDAPSASDNETFAAMRCTVGFDWRIRLWAAVSVER
ncbi:hypothetical protein BSIN_3017 [Burkholderia singularis]|uniref:Uncharacterized protein n=1 Tax=Burkholderia singularis TaxID=1503053 RepID=A0A238H3K7_9BURK|nr:hypothetical protein BSIN_3017 [Burkholderia singularis]